MPVNSLIDRTDAAALIPEDAARDIIQSVTETSAVMRLANRRPNMTRKQQRIPVVDTLPTAYWVTGDTGLKQTTEMAWKNVYLNAEELAVIVPLPQTVLDDSDYDIAAEMKPYLVAAMGIAFDQAVLFGVNKPSTYPTDIVTSATAASNTVTAGTGADLYDDIFGVNGTLQKVRSDGYAVTGHIGDLTMEGRLESVRDANGNPIFFPDPKGEADMRLRGRPLIMPTNGAWVSGSALLISGQWDQLVYSIRQDITYSVADQAAIFDNSGNLVYALFQQDMIAIRAVMRIAVAVPNPINRVNTNNSTRYPFAALLP